MHTSPIVAFPLVPRLAITMVILAQAVSAAPADWPQWRGPARDGVAPAANVPKVWPESFRKAWAIEVGEGYSSPVVAHGRAFVHSRRDPDELVTAIDLFQGGIIWQQKYPAATPKNPYADKMAKGPYATPLVKDRRLFTSGFGGMVVAWEAKSGRELWRRDFSPTVVTTNLFCGAAASPLAVGKRIVIQTGSDQQGGRILALNAVSGATEWEWQGPGPGYASPLLVKLPGGEQIVTLTEASVIGLEAGTGRELWSTPFPDQWHENIATPVWTGSRLIVSGTRQGTHAYSITRTNGAWQASPVWKSKEVAMYMSSPVVGDGVIYAHSAKKSGQLVAFDPETGAIKWATDGRSGDHAALLLTPRNLLWLTKDGNLSVVRRSAMESHVERTYTVAETETWAIPVPLGNDLLVRDASHLIRLEPGRATGQ